MIPIGPAPTIRTVSFRFIFILLCPFNTHDIGSSNAASEKFTLSSSIIRFPWLTALPGILTYSANPPSILIPNAWYCEHKCVLPSIQWSQIPHPIFGATQICIPSSYPETILPFFSIIPLISWPSVRGWFPSIPLLPFCIIRKSVPQTAAAFTLRRISSSRISGTGHSTSRRSSFPYNFAASILFSLFLQLHNFSCPYRFIARLYDFHCLHTVIPGHFRLCPLFNTVYKAHILI